jgi:hypothetical protein
MTDCNTRQPISITGLSHGTIAVREELHFSGGLRARKAGEGWALVPLLREGSIRAIGEIPDEQIGDLGRAMGLTLLGADSISGFDTPLPTRIWTPLVGPPRLMHAASDTWGMNSSQARIAGDGVFGKLASNVAVSLRAAGLQLRNASDEYHKQLLAALISDKSINRRFQNAPMDDLHLAFHSVLTEMAVPSQSVLELA